MLFYTLSLLFSLQTFHEWKTERKIQIHVESKSTLYKFYWWFVEVPYWFKASFLPKILGNLSTRNEVDYFTQGEIQPTPDETYSLIFNHISEKIVHTDKFLHLLVYLKQ